MTFPHHQDSLNFLAQEPSITLSASLPTLPFLTSYVLALSLLPEQTGLCILLCLCMEKAMAPHSSTLAWKIPWAEETGRLQSMGSWRVRHDWATSLSLFTFMHWRRKWQPTPVFLPGESQRQGSLVGCRLWGRTELDWSDLTAVAAELKPRSKVRIKTIVKCTAIMLNLIQSIWKFYFPSPSE